jgi:hypothetical protein
VLVAAELRNPLIRLPNALVNHRRVSQALRMFEHFGRLWLWQFPTHRLLPAIYSVLVLFQISSSERTGPSL